MYRAGCRLEPGRHPSVEFHLGHTLLAGESYVVEDGQELLARCAQPEAVFNGEREVVCRDGQWSPALPHCANTYQADRGFGVSVELT